jgi:hypothetical protein
LGRKKKVEIPEEQLTQLDNNEISAKDLGEQYNQPRSYFDNLKHNRKLKTSFALKTADKSMSNQEQPQLNSEQAPQMQAEHQLEPQINYHTAVKGLYKGADSIFKLVSVMSRGQLIYTNVDDKQLEDLASITENDGMVRKIATAGGVSSIVTVGSIMATFGGQFKIVKKVKHDEKNPACKCDKCEQMRALVEQAPQEEITDLGNVKPINTEELEKSKTEKLGEEIKNAFKEAPLTDSTGMIIEKNIPSNLTESQVLEQNKFKDYGGA